MLRHTHNLKGRRVYKRTNRTSRSVKGKLVGEASSTGKNKRNNKQQTRRTCSGWFIRLCFVFIIASILWFKANTHKWQKTRKRYFVSIFQTSQKAPKVHMEQKRAGRALQYWRGKNGLENSHFPIRNLLHSSGNQEEVCCNRRESAE